ALHFPARARLRQRVTSTPLRLRARTHSTRLLPRHHDVRRGTIRPLRTRNRVTAAGRNSHRRLGDRHALLPHSLAPRWALVSDLVDIIRAARADVHVRHVVRPRLPSLEHHGYGRFRGMPGNPVTRRARHHRVGRRLVRCRPVLHHTRPDQLHRHSRGANHPARGGRLHHHPPHHRLTRPSTRNSP